MTKKLDSLHRLSDWAPRLAIGGGLALGIALLCLAAPRQEPADSANGASSDRPVVHAVALQPPQSALVVSKSIENVRVGQRVPSKNPSGEFDRSLGDEVDPPTWRRLELRAPKRDGTHADVVLLRPRWWLQQRAAEVGGTVYISVPECGIDGNAELLAVGPCPPVAPGEGRVVIGTFKHQSAAVIDVSVEGLEEPIGVTVNHPFWSDDRQDFVRADALHIGERLHGLTGSPRITAISPRGPPEPVYNLEVHGEHCYQVTSLGIVVHNTLPILNPCFVPTRSVANRNLSRAEWKALYRDQRLLRRTSSTYKQRFDQSPVNNGSWSKGRAESTFTSTHPSVSGRSVNYQNAYADLTPFAKHTVESDDFVSIVGNARNPRYDLHKHADAILGARLGVSPKLIKKFRTTNKFAWHEVQDMRTLQLVPADINSKFGHLGGISEALGQ